MVMTIVAALKVKLYFHEMQKKKLVTSKPWLLLSIVSIQVKLSFKVLKFTVTEFRMSTKLGIYIILLRLLWLRKEDQLDELLVNHVRFQLQSYSAKDSISFKVDKEFSFFPDLKLYSLSALKSSIYQKARTDRIDILIFINNGSFISLFPLLNDKLRIAG